MSGRRGALAALLVAALAAAACRAPAAPASARATPEPSRRTLASSIEGRPLEVVSFGAGPRTVLVTASIHGDEAAGTPLCEELVRRLEGAPAWAACARVIVLATSNPDGVARGTRRNAAGVDLNRDFPAQNRRARGSPAPTQPESRALHDLILSEGVTRIVTFHQAADLVDWDGPAEGLARAMAEASSLPPERMGSRPGSLGSWAGVDLGLEVITVELPRSAEGLGPLALWQRYGALLEVAIAYGHGPPGPGGRH